MGDPVSKPKLEVKPLSKDTALDFTKYFSRPDTCGCYCVAWYIPTWDGWSERTAEQNKRFRDTLFTGGVYDGYLLYLNGTPIGWIQVLPIKTSAKLGALLKLKSTVEGHVIGCFHIASEYRKKKLSLPFLKAVIEDLKARKIKTILAIPKIGAKMDDAGVWNGPARIFEKAGFEVGEEIEDRRIYYLQF